jgi:glycerol kinase
VFLRIWIFNIDLKQVGITHYTQKGHIARATLEATCCQTKAILDAMEKDSGHALRRLAVDGGMSNSDLCMQVRLLSSNHNPSSGPLSISYIREIQTQSDLISIPVDRPKMRETTALGAAIAAGLAVGVWKDLEELKDINTEGVTVFEPKMSKDASKKLFERWEKAVHASAGFV